MKKRLLLLIKALFFLIMSNSCLLQSSFKDVAFMLRHADYELKSSTLFQEGVYDLTLIFQHGLYQSRPALEKKFISLIKYAQTYAKTASSDIYESVQNLSNEVFELYRGTRYSLDIGLIENEKSGHQESVKIEKKKQESAGKKVKKSKVSNQLIEPPWIRGRSACRKTGARKKKAAPKKKKVTKLKKEKQPKKVKIKKLTKKQLAILESESHFIAPDGSSVTDDVVINMQKMSTENKKVTAKKKIRPKDDLMQDTLVQDETLVSQPKKKRVDQKRNKIKLI
ncbi:hypothetical protein JKY79_02580 [Candidatus Babeliales bacterium]|nr:hypothetical protein [Candidatus Babeliales bacterium]